MRAANPVLGGFHPDPSVCCVDGWFYLATSTFEFLPGLPIMRSRDLVRWETIGHAATAQFRFDRIAQGGGMFAPTLRHHAGRFHLVCTLVGGGGNFLVTASDPAGPWSDPVWIDDAWFDPDIAWDADGTCWYTRRHQDGIATAPLDVASGRLLAPLQVIHRGFRCQDIEGPHLYRIGDHWYLMAAEGGTRFGHSIMLARSRSPLGPYEDCPRTPWLTHRDRGHGPIRDIGHGDLVRHPDGSWWLLCLGTRHQRYDSASWLGRETFLVPVRWEDGWPLPAVDEVTVQTTCPPPTGHHHLPTGTRCSWEGPGWLGVRALPNGRVEGDVLHLDGGPGPEASSGNSGLRVRRVSGPQGSFSTRLLSGNAGIVLYLTHAQQMRIEVADGRVRLVRRVDAGLADIGPWMEMPDDALLACTWTDGTATCSIGGRRLGSMPLRLLAPELSATWCWTGLTVGVFALGPAQFGTCQWT